MTAYSRMTLEQKKKVIARSTANVYKRNGKIIPQPCEVPGCTNKAQMHHPDYSKPLEVEWMCQQHHRGWHRILDGKFLKNEDGKV